MSDESLHLDQYRADRAQRHEWRIIRISNLVFLGILGLAGVGIFGDGPLADAAVQGQAYSVQYERFGRAGRSGKLAIQVRRVEDRHITLEVDGFLNGVRLGRVVPQPDEELHTERGIAFRFAAQPGTPAAIEIQFDNERSGYRSGRVRLGDETHPLWAFTYP